MSYKMIRSVLDAKFWMMIMLVVQVVTATESTYSSPSSFPTPMPSISCNKGFYCDSPSKSTICPKGSYCPRGSSSPIRCPKGSAAVPRTGMEKLGDCFGEVVFTYQGSLQNYTVPTGATFVEVELWAGGGGGGRTTDSNVIAARGGSGGYTRCAVNVTDIMTLEVLVGEGGGGASSSYSTSGSGYPVGEGGYGGGAVGYGTSGHWGSGGGGGRSHVRSADTDVGVDLVFAGGGGGGGACRDNSSPSVCMAYGIPHGGAGGGFAGGEGRSGYYATGGLGGNQTGPGSGRNGGTAANPRNSNSGSGHNGGDGYDNYGGGGGGGWYGGAGGASWSDHVYGGGGGSGYLGGCAVDRGFAPPLTQLGSDWGVVGNASAKYSNPGAAGASGGGNGGNGLVIIRLICPPGKYCPGGTHGLLTCPKGSYCPAGSSAHIECPVGSAVTPEEGMRSIEDCLGVQVFTYEGFLQNYTVPTGADLVEIEVRGGGGGGAGTTSSVRRAADGGSAGYSHCVVNVTMVTTLEVLVGQGGYGGTASNGNSDANGGTNTAAAAYGGGGKGYGNDDHLHGGGGGRSHVRGVGSSGPDFVFAGGGGGGGSVNVADNMFVSYGYPHGGAGGGLQGGAGLGGAHNAGGLGGTQTSAGAGQEGRTDYFGVSGSGHRGGTKTQHAPGGGGGWYGGASGVEEGGLISGGGGGSGFIGGCLTELSGYPAVTLNGSLWDSTVEVSSSDNFAGVGIGGKGTGATTGNGGNGGNGLAVLRTVCPPGSYCPGGSKGVVTCGTSSYCPAGSSAPFACSEHRGWFNPDLDWCQGMAGTPWVNNGVTHDCKKCFDGNVSTYINPQGTSRHSNNWWVELDFSCVRPINMMMVTATSLSHCPRTIELQCKKNSTENYRTLRTVLPTCTDAIMFKPQYFAFERIDCQLFRWVTKKTHTGWQAVFAEANFAYASPLAFHDLWWYRRASMIIHCYTKKSSDSDGVCNLMSLGTSGTSLTVEDTLTYNNGSTANVYTTPMSSTAAMTCYQDSSNANKGTCTLLVASSSSTLSKSSPLVVTDYAVGLMPGLGMTPETAIVCPR